MKNYVSISKKIVIFGLFCLAVFGQAWGMERGDNQRLSQEEKDARVMAMLNSIEQSRSLRYAVGNNNINDAMNALGAGADVDSSYGDGWTPLHLAACKKKSFKMAELLIKNGAHVNATDDFFGRTALCCAILTDNFKTAKLLIKNGADLDATDNKGFTPLHLAVLRNNQKIIKLLIESGAKVNVTNKESKTQLQLILHKGYFEFLKNREHPKQHNAKFEILS